MTGREQLLDQLRKLQVLAKRAAGTPEGAVARRKLEELLVKYGLTLKDLRPAKAPAAARPAAQPGTIEPSIGSSESIPITIRVDIGGMRIRWKL